MWRFLKKAWWSTKGLTAKLNAELGRNDTVWALKACASSHPKFMETVSAGWEFRCGASEWRPLEG